MKLYQLVSLKQRAYQLFIFSILISFGLLTIIGTGGGNGDDNGNGKKTGALQINTSSYEVTEGTDGRVNIFVTRSGGSDGAVSVEFATADGMAEAGSDYTGQQSTLNWPDGVSGNRTISIVINDDTKVELPESFTVELLKATGATLGPKTSATVSILDNDSISIVGNVRAPNGTIAFNGPSLFHRLLASVFGRSALATIDELISPVPSVTVNAYEVDATGELVDSTPITSSTTDGNGAYTLAAPLDAPASKYIVRAMGSTTNLDSRIHQTNISVDPLSDSVSKLVTDITADLTTININEIQVIHETLVNLIEDIDTSGVNSSTLSQNLFNEAKDNISADNIIRSTATDGSICGSVFNSSAIPIANTRIVVKDYLDRVTRAHTYTNIQGNYCVNVAIGEYIVGAINLNDDNNDPNRSASEWWSQSGGSYHQYHADLIVVSNSTPVTGYNFQLDPGGRITGSVTANDSGASLAGVEIIVRDFDDRYNVASDRVNAIGRYKISVAPGQYLVIARNRTTHSYASEIYNTAGGTNRRNFGTPVTVATGEEITIDFVLEQGRQLNGSVIDGTSSVAVAGTRVLVNQSGSAVNRISTNNKGNYRIWLEPGSYDILAYGQRSPAVDMLSVDQSVDFSAAVTEITGTLRNLADTEPVNRAQVRLYDESRTLLGYELSKADGSFTTYSDETGNHLLSTKIIKTSTVGSEIYDGHTQLLAGNPIVINTVGEHQSLGSINLPDATTLSGYVYTESSDSQTLTPIANFRVQLRDDDDLSTAGVGTQPEQIFQQIRTRGDGSYHIAVPFGTYDRIKMGNVSGVGNCNGITLQVAANNILNYYLGNNSCELNP